MARPSTRVRDHFPTPPGEIEDSRGAGALLAAVRSARALNRMTREEASKPRLAEKERWSFFRVDNGKANLAPPGERAVWRRMESVDLGNGTDDRPSDLVGVATAWQPPDAFDGVTAAHVASVHAAMDPDGHPVDRQSEGLGR